MKSFYVFCLCHGLYACCTGFKLAWAGQQIPAGTTNQGFLLLIFAADTELLYVQYLYPAVRLLPQLDCHVLWDESTTHAHSALLHLYQMCLQLLYIQKGSPHFSVTAIAVNVDPHDHAVELPGSFSFTADRCATNQ